MSLLLGPSIRIESENVFYNPSPYHEKVIFPFELFVGLGLTLEYVTEAGDLQLWMDDREALKITGAFFDLSEQTTEFGLTVDGKLVQSWPIKERGHFHFLIAPGLHLRILWPNRQVEWFCGRLPALPRKPPTPTDFAQIRRLEVKADAFKTSLDQYLASNGSLKKQIKVATRECQLAAETLEAAKSQAKPARGPRKPNLYVQYLGVYLESQRLQKQLEYANTQDIWVNQQIQLLSMELKGAEAQKAALKEAAASNAKAFDAQVLEFQSLLEARSYRPDPFPDGPWLADELFTGQCPGLKIERCHFRDQVNLVYEDQEDLRNLAILSLCFTGWKSHLYLQTIRYLVGVSEAVGDLV